MTTTRDLLLLQWQWRWAPRHHVHVTTASKWKYHWRCQQWWPVRAPEKAWAMETTNMNWAWDLFASRAQALGMFFISYFYFSSTYDYLQLDYMHNITNGHQYQHRDHQHKLGGAMSKILRPWHPWKGPNDKTIVWALCNVFIFIFCLLLLTAYF